MLNLDLSNKSESTTANDDAQKIPKEPVTEVANKIVDMGSNLLKKVTSMGPKNEGRTTNEAIHHDENMSVAVVIYNKLKKIQDKEKRNELKRRVFAILYQEL